MLFDTTFPAQLLGSPLPGCEVAPATNVTCTFQMIHNGSPTTVGTLPIAAGTTTGSYVWLSKVTVPAGDRLRLYAAGAVDPVIAGLYGTIFGTYQTIF